MPDRARAAASAPSARTRRVVTSASAGVLCLRFGLDELELRLGLPLDHGQQASGEYDECDEEECAGGRDRRKQWETS